MITKAKFKHYVENMENCEVMYLDAINLRYAGIDLLRSYIKTGILSPSPTSLKGIVNPEYYNDVINGIVIIPQMYYIKNLKSTCNSL